MSGTNFSGVPTKPQFDFRIHLIDTAKLCVTNDGNRAIGAPMKLAGCNLSRAQAFHGATLVNTYSGGW